jgi:hypothetical protein
MPISDDLVLRVRLKGINDMGKPIVVKLFRSSAPNLKTGDVQPDFTPIEIEKSLVSGLEKMPQGSLRTFKFPASHLTRRPDLRDVIVYREEEYKVVDARSDQRDLIYEVVARKP